MSLPLMERHIDVDEVVRPTTVEVARFTGTDHQKKKKRRRQHARSSEMGRELYTRALNSTGIGPKHVKEAIGCRSLT